MIQKNPSANLEGVLRLIPASKVTLSPLYEAINNSIESLNFRDVPEGKKIEITLNFNDLDSQNIILNDMKVVDNGDGFNEDSYARFKQILDKSKGYNNRGTGRLQYIHRFSEISVDSHYKENGKWKKRSFKCNKEKFIYANNESTNASVLTKHQTTVHMKGFKALNRDHSYFQNLSFERFASIVRAQFSLRAYLDKKKGIDFPTFILRFEFQVVNEPCEIEITPKDFREPKQEGSFEVNYYTPCLDKYSEIKFEKDTTTSPEIIKWAVFEFDESEVVSHGAFLCSKDIPVEEIKNPILSKKISFEGKKKITAFYGDYLDRPSHVNDSVDSFTIKRRDQITPGDISNDMFEKSSFVYLDDIEEKAKTQLLHIYEDVAKEQERLKKSVLAIAKSLGISLEIARKVKISLSDNDDSITQKLYAEEGVFLASKSNQMRKVIDELSDLDPTSCDYQKQLSEKSTVISSLIDSQNKEELSKYVVRREIITSLLDKALKVQLSTQLTPLPKGRNRDREGVIHDLIFKRKNSVGPNDLWILNEEFVHFDGFSEMRIKDFKAPDGKELIDPVYAEEMEGYGFNSDKRPDIFLFAEEGKCVIVEFKEPNTNLSHYIHQMPQYCKLLANYSTIKITNFYCYLIGEKIHPEADLDEYEESVNGDWYRDSIPVKRSGGNRERIASIRMEIIKLSDIHKRAHRRNKNFAQKLGLDELFSE